MFRTIQIDGQDTKYQVDENGVVINSETGRRMTVNSGGTVNFTINKRNKGRSIGKIVAQLFIENPEGYDKVTHINGDKTDNRVENLRWISDSENSKNVWELRRKNGTTSNPGNKKGKVVENIVENYEDYNLEEDEKLIVIDDETIPYAVRKDGRIRNIKTNNELKGSILHSYRYINFRYDGKNKNKAVHRIIAEAFIPNPDNLPVVDHIDGDRLNNTIENLRWATHSENMLNRHPDKTPEKPSFEEVVYTQEELDNEEWKEHTSGLTVSNLGRVRGKKGHLLDGSKEDCGYMKYSGVLGHILVWEAFNGEKERDMDINHINGNKHDNRLSNLEQVTHRENMQKAADETNAWGFRKVGEYNDDGELLRTFNNASDAARQIGILPGSMRNTIRRNGKCFNGLSYRYIED